MQNIPIYFYLYYYITTVKCAVLLWIIISIIMNNNKLDGMTASVGYTLFLIFYVDI